jgi:hypothetical protein
MALEYSHLPAMTMLQDHSQAFEVLDVGSYTAPEAARLLKTSALNINRWLKAVPIGAPAKNGGYRPFGLRSIQILRIILLLDFVI